MINPYEYRKKAQLAIGGVDYNVQPLINNNNGNTIQQESSNESEQNWFVRGISTLGNVVKNVVQGCVKSIEGIVDAGAMLVGLFGADVDSFVNYDFTADVFGTDEEGEGLLEWSWGRALSNASYLDDDNFVNQVANGVGGMLPTIALAVASGGTSIAGTAAAKAGTAAAKALSVASKALSVASKVAFVAGAAGNASEEAFNQGANYGQALGYGALSGAIEAGTEYIGGRVMGETTDLSKTLLGKLAIKTGADKAISTGVGKATYTFVSEGMEEVLSDLLNPVAKRITGVDEDATVDWGELPKTFLVGGATASVLNGIRNGASALKNSDKGGKHFVKIAEEMQTIENTIGAQTTLQSKQGLSQENYDIIGTRANERTLRSLESMSSELKKMTSEERAKALKTISENSPTIANVFEESGDIKNTIIESIQESVSNRVVGNTSADLVLRGDEVKATIDEVNKETGYKLEIDNDVLSEVERGNYAKEIRAIQNIGKISNSNLSLVLVKNNKNVNSFIEKRGNIIYVTRETLSNGTWANKLAHEVTHFAEDSKEFKRFVDYVLDDQETVKEAINDIIKASYEITENDLTRTISKLASNKKLTKKENLAYSELIAHISEKLFTDEKSINRLARSDKGLLNKIKNRLVDIIDALKNTNAKETISKLKKAEKLFNNALESIAREKEEFARKLRKTTTEYKRDKKIYNMLEEDEKASWLEEHGYVSEDFNDEILDNGESQEGNGDVSLTPSVAFSKKSFSQQIDEVISGTYENYSHLQVRENTPKILQDIGLENKPMLITAVHTKTAIGQDVAQKNIHHLSIETLKNLPQLLETPAVVMESVKAGSVVVFVNAVDNENNPVMCSILLEGKGQYNNIVIDTNLITSIYGKDTNPVGFIQKAIDENRILFWDKKISQDLSVKTGLQLSNLMSNLDSNTIIRQINKKSTEKNKNTKKILNDSQGNALTKEQKEYFKDSKVVDANGNLLVMYHGTNSDDFYVFDKSKIGLASGDMGFFGKGFYFATHKEEAKYYGNKIIDTYLNIKNPYYFSEELFNYNNQEAKYDRNSDLIFITNFVDKFSDILPSGLSAYSFTQNRDISLKEIAKIYKDTFKNKKFDVKETNNYSYGQQTYTFSTDKEIVKFNDKEGKEHSFEEYGFTVDSLDKNLTQAELSSIYIIKKYELDNIPNFKQIILECEFSEKLKSLGYDGIMQSIEGDEVVAFEPNQIKRVDNKTPTNNDDIRFSLKDNTENLVKEKYGDTYRWKEVGYILLDGTRLDLSGRNEGAPGGYRSIDHREIFEDMVVDDEDYATSENMIEFMGRGNIRVIPEYPGINLQIEPNEAQYKRIGELVENLGWKEESFIVDFDDKNGDVKDTLEYNGKVSFRKVIDDIKYYFKEGKKPYQSDLSKFRFSLKDSQGNDLSQEQEKYFRNSKVRDNEGNLLVVYNGTKTKVNGEDIDLGYVYKFQKESLINKSYANKFGFFFTDNVELAEEYSQTLENGEIKKGRINSVYLNIKHPLDISSLGTRSTEKQFYDLLGEKGVVLYKSRFLQNDWKPVWKRIDDRQENLRREIESAGYDGLIFADYGQLNNTFVAFESSQIKNIDNKAPTLSDDIRYSRKPANEIKAKANLVYDNIYTKKETRQFVEDILSQTESDIDELTYGTYISFLKGKTNIIETFFEKLNSTEGKSKTKIARDMTDYIIDSISVEEVTQSEIAKESLDELKVLREYRNKIDISEYSKEINTVKGNNALILQWGKKGGLDIYDVVRELQEKGHFTQVDLQDTFNGFDLFEEFTDYYSKLVEDVRNTSKTAISTILSEEKLIKLRESITNNLLEMVKEGGELSTLGKLKENFANSIKSLKQQFAKDTNYWKAKATYQGDIWRTIADLRGYTEKGKIEKLGSATVLKDPYFKKMIEDMGKITWGGRIDPTKARACMEGLKQFFNKDNKLLQDYFEATYGETLSISDISQATSEIEGTSNSMFNHLLDQFAELELAKKEDGTYKTNYLTTEELKATSTILKMCKHFLLHYDAIYEDGIRIEQKKAATEYYELAEKSFNTHIVHKTQFIGWLSNKIFDYNAMVMSPKFVCEMLDGYYENGFNTHYQQRFWRDSLQMEYDRMSLLEDSDKFFNENKEYKKRLFDKEIQVKIGNYSLTIAEAVDLYLMSTQDNGLLTLTEGAGFVFDNERGGVTQCGTINQEQIEEMYEQFTEKDREYINILKEIYKKGGTNYKKPTDIARMGFSNIIDGEYYTLTRWKEAIAKSTSDIRSAIKDIQIANNLSINKTRRTRAKNIPLMVGDSYQKMIRYVNQVTLYKNFSEDLANFDKLFTKNISDTTSPKTVKMIMDSKVWDKTSKYWGDLLADIQGVGITQDNVSTSITKVLEALRSNYAKAQLGFNLKVCMSQFASYPTAFIKLDAGILTRALGHSVNYEDMDKYSQAAISRNYNKAIVKAEGIIDKVSSLGNVLTKGIQWSDRKTIGRLWVASQLQIEKIEGLKFGSIENMKKAGVLLDEVITETQPTYIAIDRSALQRSKNTLAKTISMFTSVPMKQISNLIGSIAKLKAYKTRIRLGENIGTKELNQVKNGVVRAVGANIAANLMYAIICQLIKHIYNKDDEDENNGETIPEQILSQFLDTSISMFPIVSDVYEGITKGYEIDVYETSAINDLIASIKSVVDLAEKVVNGEADTQDIMNSVKKSLFAGGLIVGIPVRNMYNTIYGLTKRISPSSAYKINSLFIDPKVSDLKTALNNNDTQLASTILTSLMGKKGFSLSQDQAGLLAELYSEGYSLPSSIPDKVTINGEEIELSIKQQGEFSKIYTNASIIVDKLLSDGSLNGKTNEIKAKTVSYIYKYYYYEAEAKSLNVDIDSKLYMFGQLIDIQKLASIIAEVPLIIEGVVNKKTTIQRYLQKQKLSAAQKYILMGYFGYKNKNGEGLVRSLINRTGLSKTQKSELLEKCGY